MSVQGRTPGSEGSLGELATRQYGVVSMAQLRALGHAKSTVVEWVASGRLHRVHRGVYAVGHRHLTWHGRCLAAVLAAETLDTGTETWPALASHTSAAYLWGLLRYVPETIHVTAPIRRRAQRDFKLHFSSCLAEEDRALSDDVPLTSVPRTLLDLAIGAPPERLERYLERAEERDQLDLIAMEALLARAGGHRGRGRLRRALAIYRPDLAVTRSGLERRFRELVVAAGLPAPSMNFNVGGFELDAYWERERFAVELDVYETHGSRAAFERDRLRQEELKLIGIEVVRVTGARLEREPGRALERIAALLAQRRRQLSR